MTILLLVAACIIPRFDGGVNRQSAEIRQHFFNPSVFISQAATGEGRFISISFRDLTYDNLRQDYNGYQLQLDVLGRSADFYNYPDGYRNVWISGQTFNYMNPQTGYPMHEHAAELGYNNMGYPIDLTAEIDDYEWNNAMPGSYATTLNFRSEVHFSN